MTGASYITDFLARHGVGTVFGYPGAAVLSLYDCLFSSSSVGHVLVRHEQGAVLAAVGYAKASGKTGVCIATSGPGAANLITGIADAYLDSVPLIVITGQVESGFIGRDAFQEADIMGMTIPITKHNYLIRDPDTLPQALEEAWRIAADGRPGPVLIDVARDVFDAEVVPDESFVPVLPRHRPSAYTVEAALSAIREELENCHRPLILAGGGVIASGAGRQLCAFAGRAGIPVVTTLMGRGIPFDDTVLDCGMTGLYGTEAGRTALSQCDLLIAVGVRFSDRTVSNFRLFSQSRMIIHCDVDPAELDKNVTATVRVVSDAAAFFEALTEAGLACPRPAYEDWNRQLAEVQKNAASAPVGTSDRLSVPEITAAVDAAGRRLGGTVYVSDVGNFQMCAATTLHVLSDRGFLTSGGLGAMGFGLPAAIGASFSVPDTTERLVVFCGDGGFQMSMEELATLPRAARPIKIFIFDNGRLGMIRDLQTGDAGGVTDLVNPDFEAIARAYGIPSVHLDVSDRGDLEKAVCDLLAAPGSLVVHCPVL